jgi:hypothetical protein
MILQGLYMIWQRVCRVFDDKQINRPSEKAGKALKRLF